MAELWQIRECEQGQFIEKLADEVRDAADASGNYTLFICKFCIALIESISTSAGEKPLVYSGNKAENKLRDKMVDKIRDFQRVGSEMVYLLGRLLDKLSVGIYSFVQREYQRDGIINPREVFGEEL